MQLIAEYQSRMKTSICVSARPPSTWLAFATTGKASSGGTTASGVGKRRTNWMVKSNWAASSGLRSPPVTLTSQTSTQRSAQSVAKVSDLPNFLRARKR